MQRRITVVIAALALALAPATALAGGVLSAADDSYTTNEDTDLHVDAPGLLDNDAPGNPDNVLCVASVDTADLTGTLDWHADGSFTYSPPANFNGLAKNNSFNYTIYEIADGDPCEGTSGAAATVEIGVDPVNDAPTARADSFSALKNETLVINAPGVLSNDTDVEHDSLTAVKVNNPTHGVVVLAADGSFSYTPTANFTGTDTFSYKASDGLAQSATKVVTITVSSIPPINTPTPAPPTPTPSPTPEPTLSPVVTPPIVEATLDPGASPTEFVPPTPQVSAPPTADAGASAASLAPGQTAVPATTSGGGFGSPLTILLGITLLALIGGVAAAMYGPRWLESRRNRAG
ncbi:MAG TPA: Ig-like domain-containing protein [Candidatus Limnocylindrales bacterium]|nr:Ig-like domain-containing protein [Candidatus Limnocylindrales bacterium]